jgi:hypothetical protein
MDKKNKLFTTLLLAIPLALLTSCGGEVLVVEKAIEEEVVIVVPVGNETYYRIPSPDEMFDFIKESGLSFNGELLNSIKNVDRYSDPKKQALNFGIYTADLAYTSAFKEFIETTKYFVTVQKLAESVGISAAFDPSTIERAMANLNNADSLVAITNTSYFAVVDYLEQNEQGDKLGLIASAGWLETVYVIANSIDYSKDKGALNRLADQKFALDNLLDYMSEYKENADVAEVLTWFNELELVFANLAQKESKGAGISFKKKESGKMLLGGGASISMSEDQFNAIKEKVNQIRNNIVKTEG